MNSKVISGDREIASIFKQSQEKSIVTYEWELTENATWIVKPFDGSISSVVIYGKNISCTEDNIIKVHGPDKITFYVTKSSMIKCKSDTPKKVKVDYNFNKYSLNDVGPKNLQHIGDILKGIEKNKMGSVIEKIESLGLDDLFEKNMSLEELKSLPLKEGDYIKVKIWPQLQKVNCPDGKCQLQVNVFGLLDFEKLGQLNGMNQLKYQEVSPFLFFCGSRYTAGNIYFRADEKMEFGHIIDENGFSCDINSFLLNNSKLSYNFKVKWISRENLQTILMGKLEEFIKQKNISQENRIKNYITEILALNTVKSKEFTGSSSEQILNGHIELWWEPFDRCKDRDDQQCLEKEMIMTRSRVIYDSESKRMTKDIHLIQVGLKQIINTEDIPVAFVVKLCPEDVDTFLLDQMDSGESAMSLNVFKQTLLSYEKKSCTVVDSRESGKEFDYRWLLATVPKEIEKEEIDLLVEDYQVLETPSEDRLKKDPFQKGKIFFDIYMKNLKNREVLFKRSRIIEVTK